MTALRIAILFLLLCAGSALADERILSFDSIIEVEMSGDLLVTETIRVRAEGKEIKRGIYRDIPRLHKTKWGLKKKKPFKVLSVLQNGIEAHFAVEEIGQAGVRIRIGQEHKFLPRGVYTYEIKYRTGMQIYFEKKRDALYWNVNGTEWGFPIDAVSAEVVLPAGIEVSDSWAYTGKRRAQGMDYKSVQRGNRVRFTTTRPLGPKENLTVFVQWPPGKLAEAAHENGMTTLLREHPVVVLATVILIGAVVYYFVAWFLVGKDPDKGVIIPQFGPPAGFSPGAVRYLDRMGFDNSCFSAGVVGLAVKGVATIEEHDKTYTVIAKGVDQQSAPLNPDEQRLYNKLLGSGSIELKQKHHKRIGGARKALQKMLASKLEKTHFVRNIGWWLPGFLASLLAAVILVLATGVEAQALFLLVWLSIWTVGTTALVSRCINLWRSGSVGLAIGSTVFALPFVAGWVGGAVGLFFSTGIWATVAFVVAGVLNVLFYHLIKAPTHLGRRVMDHIEGFKHYLSVAEEERLNLQNPPERTPELFERFLPYALALDCEQKWSEKFDAVLKAAGQAPGESGTGRYHPSFYTGSYTGMDSAMTAAAIGGALTGALASSSSAPSSGGSGGGGSSGGGGGGGGGGGW